MIEDRINGAIEQLENWYVDQKQLHPTIDIGKDFELKLGYDASFEELLYISNQVQLKTNITPTQALFSIISQYQLSKNHLKRYLKPDIELKYFEQIVTETSIEDVRKKYSPKNVKTDQFSAPPKMETEKEQKNEVEPLVELKTVEIPSVEIVEANLPTINEVHVKAPTYNLRKRNCVESQQQVPEYSFQKRRSKLMTKDYQKQVQQLKKYSQISSNYERDLQKAVNESLRMSQQLNQSDQVDHVQDQVDEDYKINKIIDRGYQIDHHNQEKYFGVKKEHSFDFELLIKENLDGVVPFYKFDSKTGQPERISNLFWQNTLNDGDHPFDTQMFGKQWKFIDENIVNDRTIQEFLSQSVNLCNCECIDGCINPKTCPCYRKTKLNNQTYQLQQKHQTLDDVTMKNQLIRVQFRSNSQRNVTFSHCNQNCFCKKNDCKNFLIGCKKQYKWKFCIMKKACMINEPNGSPDNQGRKMLRTMWGLTAMEDIPAGAFVTEYVGEVITKRFGDIRGQHYDQAGSSYLFDMNDPTEEEMTQDDNFHPFCIDATFYGNESRFVNHSCDPNLRTFSLQVDSDSQTFHSIGMFAKRKICAGEELTIDYQWDENHLEYIDKDVICLCGTSECRGFLLRSKSSTSTSVSPTIKSMNYQK